jgi:hypothetical protein
MALPLPVVIQAEQWAQCDNPNCQKWRKLPASTTLNDDEPWYCYLNPDHNKNTCSASEVVSTPPPVAAAMLALVGGVSGRSSPACPEPALAILIVELR